MDRNKLLQEQKESILKIKSFRMLELINLRKKEKKGKSRDKNLLK